LASATAATTAPRTDPLLVLTAELQTRKVSLDGLSTFDHLRRDYKEYAFPLSTTGTGSQVLLAGLSTVPQPLDQREDLLPAVRQWMARRRLHVYCVLTSFVHEGMHKREQAWVIRRDAVDTRGDEDVDAGLDGGTLDIDLDELASTLWKDLEASSELALKPHPNFDLKGAEAGERVKVYTQRANVTRKFTAPLMKRIIEGHRWAATDTTTTTQ
jgi:exopolyphosphatase